jgi:hypothetical protein
VPDFARPEPRRVPTQPDVGEAPSRAKVPDFARPEPRRVPAQPDVGEAPSRAKVPDFARPEPRRIPDRSAAPMAPSKPIMESRPHIFEDVGRGAAARDSSARGRFSTKQISPASPDMRPHSAGPSLKGGGMAAPGQFSRGSGQGKEGQLRQKQQR